MKLRYDEIRKEEKGENKKEEFKKAEKKAENVLKKIGATLLITGGMVLAIARCGSDQEEPPVYNITPRDAIVSEVGSDISSDISDVIKDAKHEDIRDGEIANEVGVDEGTRNEMCNALNSEKQISRTTGEKFVIKTEGGSTYTIEIISINPKKLEDGGIEQAGFITVWIYDKYGNKKILDDVKELESKDVVLVEEDGDGGKKEVKLNITVCKIREVDDKYYATLETSTGSLEVPVEVAPDAGVEDTGSEDVMPDVGEDAGLQDVEDVTGGDATEQDSGEDAGVKDSESDVGEDAGLQDVEDVTGGDATEQDSGEEDVMSDVGDAIGGDAAGQDVCEIKENCNSPKQEEIVLFSLPNLDGGVEEIKENVTITECTITNPDCSTKNEISNRESTFSRPLGPEEQEIFFTQFVKMSFGLVTYFDSGRIQFGTKVAYTGNLKDGDDLNREVKCLTININNGITTVWFIYNGRYYQVNSNESAKQLGNSNYYIKVYAGGSVTGGVPVALLENVQSVSNNGTATLYGEYYRVEINVEQNNPNNVTGINFKLQK